MRRSSPAWHVTTSVLFKYERRLGAASRILPAPTGSSHDGCRWASTSTTATTLGTARRPALAQDWRQSQHQVRGKKTKSVMKLSDLPQSLSSLRPASSAEDAVRAKGTEETALDAQDGGEAASTPSPRRGRRKKTAEDDILDAQDDGEAASMPKPLRGRRKATIEGMLEVQEDEEAASTPKRLRGRRKKTIDLANLASGVEDAGLERGQGVGAEEEALGVQGDDGDVNSAPKPRRARRKNTVNLADLPQGSLSPQPTANGDGGGLVGESEAGSAYPTVIQQARNNMARFENCVLLTRVGSFYELYFEQADEYGPLLNLKVAAKKTTLGAVPMAGFPFYQLDRVLKVLVQEQQCYVAIAEEFQRDPSDRIKAGGLQHDRRVTRVITPGTLIDENFMDPLANNYVMAIHVEPPTAADAAAADSNNIKTANNNTPESILGDNETTAGKTANEPTLGLAWLDVSTGQFYTQETTLGALSSILSRVGPREVVVDERLQAEGDHALFAILAEDKHLISYSAHREPLPPTAWGPMLEAEIPAATLAGFSAGEERAGSLLLQYVGERLLGLSMRLQPPVRQESLRVMTIDKNSMRALEIKQTMRDAAFRGSLLHAIRRTVTTGGARLLHEWLAAPSTALDVITQRQDLVACFLENPDLRDQVVQLLRRSHDSQRLVQKFAFGRGDPDNLLGLANTIQATEDVVALLQAADDGLASPFRPLLLRINLDQVSQLADRIRDSIDEDGLVQQHELVEDEASQILTLAEGVVSAEGAAEDAALLPKSAKLKKRAAAAAASPQTAYADDGWTCTMKRGASPGLEGLHAELDELGREKTALEAQLRTRLCAASLTLRWTPSLGHICHIKGRDARKAGMPQSVSSSRSTRTFHEPEWTGLGQRLHQTRFQVQAEEARLFAELRANVVLNLVRLRRNAAVLDELDVAAAFARLAAEQGLVRPVLSDDDARTVVVGGRHPTVEGGLREQGRSFTDNDCLVGTPGHGRLWLITGPNMAGKSTYLRQNALIAILAQVGCYVPAHHAELGLVDAVYSRVGSADNLYRDQSTFMVEMLETAQILRAATPRSFVIMDEIGRGTAPQDGAAVAFASLYHLATVNKCRTLFATHFHTLADLARERGMHVADGGPVEMYCTDVAEDGQGGFVYVHKLRKGINRESHALKVAQLAGLPKATIEMAQAILDQEAAP